MSFKDESAECMGLADKALRKDFVKKLQHKTPMSPPKLRTSSGVFTVHELTNTGERYVLSIIRRIN